MKWKKGIIIIKKLRFEFTASHASFFFFVFWGKNQISNKKKIMEENCCLESRRVLGASVEGAHKKVYGFFSSTTAHIFALVNI